MLQGQSGIMLGVTPVQRREYPLLLDEKACRERMKHMLNRGKGSRVFAKILKGHLEGLSEGYLIKNWGK